MKILIDFDLLNIASIAPMLLLCGFAIFILCINAFFRDLSRVFYTTLTILALVLDIGIVLGYNGEISGFFDMVLVDGIALMSMIVILIASALFLPLALGGETFHEYSLPEFFVLFLFMLVGYEFMVSSSNLLLIFIGLETSSLALYTLIALHNRNRAIEAAIKYFTMGALGSGFFAFGAVMFYYVTGNFDINQIASVISAENLQNSLTLAVACVFMFSSIGFKLSLIPFHTWVPDVYEGSSAALAGFMSIVPKIAGFIVALRLFETLYRSGVEWIEIVLYIVAVLTMTLANVMALIQEDIKRMLAFSSIAHAGFVLCGIVIGTTMANSALFLYWILFTFANLGAFSMLWLTRQKHNKWHPRFEHPYDKFNGLIKTLPTAAIVMAIFMLSLAGLPPFSIFWGKMYLMSAAVNSGYIILAVIMAANSAIAIYYYIRLIVCMFLKEPKAEVKDPSVYLENVSNLLRFIIATAAVLCVVSPFVMKFGIEFITKLVASSGF